MPPRAGPDAVVVGSGPNGLAAAVELARAGHSVLVREAQPTLGGGARSGELTLPGFLHDLCSAIHPLAVASPFFASLPLSEHGLEWIHPAAPLAHPLDDGSAAMLHCSIDATAAGLGEDGTPWRRLFAPLARDWSALADAFLGPMLRAPERPFLVAGFGLKAIRSASALARSHFSSPRARALFAGLAAHSVLPLDDPASSAFGLVLGAAGHAAGWPMPKGGSQRIADALASLLASHGGTIETASPVRSLADLPPSRATLLDLTPRQVLALAGERLPSPYRRSLERWRYGPAAFKVDYALAAPIPWRARDCLRAGTVHAGGTLEEIELAERQAARGTPPDAPFVLVAQPTLFDPTRAPEGRHVAWAYCHVPHASTDDFTERITAQIERFAPGFRSRILAQHATSPAGMEAKNANLVGGDISGGSNHLRQLLCRPTFSRDPYTTPIEGLYLCSSSTPPGGGVHGMCGYHAARSALRRSFTEG